MGDRCSLTITVRACDVEAVQDDDLFGGCQSDQDVDGLRELYFDEVNYGGNETRESLARRGVPYIGSHGSGDDYGAAVFCSLGETDYQWNEGYRGLQLNVRWSGDAYPGEIEDCRRFIWHHAVAELILQDPIISVQWSVWGAAKVPVSERLAQLGLPEVEDDD
jgi:hypothetical protein